MNKNNIITILVGSILGLIAAYIYSNAGSSGGDDFGEAVVFFFLAPVFCCLGAIIFLLLRQSVSGKFNQRKNAFKYLVILIVVIIGYMAYINYTEGQQTCHGESIEHYQGELPDECLNLIK